MVAGPFGTNPVRIDNQGRHIADDVPEVEGQAWVDYDYEPREREPSKCPKCGNDMILRHHCEPSAAQQKLDAIRELCETWLSNTELPWDMREGMRHILAILDREAP